MKFVIAVLVMFIATGVRSDVITFRSGDHPDFARIVADIPVGADWLVGRVNTGYALQLDPDHSFDTGPIFDRIQRNRLASVQQEPGTGRLRLNLACECHVDAFLFAPDKLVIDIKDGPAPLSSRFEISLDGPQQQQQVRLPLQLAPGRPDMTGPIPLLPDAFRSSVSSEPAMTDAEMALIESFGRAASHGLLDIDPRQQGDALRTPSGQSVTTAPQLSEVPRGPPTTALPAMTETLQPGSGQGIRIQSVTDRDRLAGAPSSGGTCLDAAHFDFLAWSSSSDFAAEISRRRAELIGEDDQYSTASVDALARTYLHFGFGHEAIAALALDGVRSADRDIIATLGQIIDELPVTGAVLAGQAGCARPVALWRALARGSIEGASEPERIAISTAYRLLPEPVRKVLSDRVAGLFLAAGDAAAAEAILAPTAVTESLGDDAVTAAIVQEIDGPAAAIEALERIVADDTRTSPEEIVALIEVSTDENRPVDEEVLSLAAALRFESRGTSEELDLGLAEFRSLLLANRFAEAGTVLSELEDLSDADRAAYQTDLSVRLSENASNSEFLEWFFDDRLDLSSARSENAAAKRLFNLGFTTDAADLLEGPAAGPDMSERRFLRAEIAQAMGQIEGMDEILSGITDPRAAALRERNLPFSGGAEETAPSDLEQSWRNGAWDQLDGSDDPILQAAASAMLTEPDLPDSDGTLSDGEALISDAENTRALARDLLERFQITSEPDAAPAN